MDKLKGKKIALVYLNNAYGKEPIPTLTALSKKHGFEFSSFPVDSPGNEQKATWLQIRRDQPDWVLLWGYGVMNQVSIKEAAGIRFPMDHFIGNWWASSENDVKPAGAEANGYLGTAFHAAGRRLSGAQGRSEIRLRCGQGRRSFVQGTRRRGAL